MGTLLGNATKTGKVLISGRPCDLVEKDGEIIFRGWHIRNFIRPELPQPVDADVFFQQQLAETGDAGAALIETTMAILDGRAVDLVPHIHAENIAQFPARSLRRSAAL